MGRLLTLILLIFSTQSWAVCLEEVYGEFYGCKSLANDKAAVKWCKKKYGETFLPYYTTNTCSKQLAFESRGEEYKPSKKEKQQDNYGVVQAACMTYEQSQKYGCEYYDYEPAQRYCTYYYGHKYLGFYPQGKCSMAQASRSRGEVSSKKLLSGLSSLMDEAEAIMTSIDRQGVASSMGGLASSEPDIGAEFYTTPIKRIMATLNMLKKQIHENSHLNVRIDGKYVKDFLQYNFRYLALLGRLYKTYAYVAHLNHYVLKSYDFKNLEYLNLQLKKEFALEIINRVNYKVLTVNEGKDLEFVVGEQDRQTYEYLAIAKPKSKVDYAKLITFIGARENLTNLWAVQRLTNKNIQAYKVNSCGKGFLSLRGPGDNMKNSAAMNDLWDYDVFYSGYAPKWDALVDASRTVSILSETKGKKLAYWTYKQVSELKTYLQTDIKTPIQDDNGFWDFAEQDGVMLNMSEDETWESFSNDHFSTIIMPGDHVRNKDKVVSQIVSAAYRKRLKAIIDTFQGAYPFLSDKGLNHVESYIKTYIDKYLKADFVQNLSEAISSALSGYNSSSLLRPKNRKEKVDEMMKIAEKTVRGAYIEKQLEGEKNIFNGAKLLDPNNMEDLLTLFERKLARFYDLRLTLDRDEKKAALLKDFFTKVSEKFQKKYITQDDYGNYQYVGSDDQRAYGLRQIVFEMARDYYQKYPYKIKNLMTRPTQDYVRNNPYQVVQDKTYVKPYMEYIPVYEDGTPALLSNKDVKNAFDPEKLKKDIDIRETYVVKQDNTYVRMNPLLIGQIPNSKKKKTTTPGYNKDKITTGEIGRPTLVTNTGNIETPKGMIYVAQEEVLSILDRANAINSKVTQAYKEKSPVEKKRKIIYQRYDADKYIISNDAQFFYRVFEALNVHMISLSDKFRGGQFANTKEDQLFLAQNLVAKAFQSAPMLRNDYTWTTTKYVEKYYTDEFGVTTYAGKKKVSNTYTLPLLYKIATNAYNSSKGVMDGPAAKSLINDVIEKAIANTTTQLATFCNANYLNYKNDDRFKKVYKAATFLRATLKSPYGASEEDVKKIEAFDEGIRKDIRTRLEAFDEDWGQPILKTIGTVALIALAVVLIIGSGGTATPGVMAGAFSFQAALAGAASSFLALEFVISLPLTMTAAYNRINTHFYEVPAQLRFQRSLAQSQVDYSEIVDWDMLRAEEKSNTRQKWMQIPLTAMDLLFAGVVFKQVRSAAGYVGRGAYRRLTDVKLRGWSAPPKSMLVKSQRFRALREEQGFFKAVKTKVKTAVINTKMYLPKYQPLPPQMLNGLPLRMGLIKQAKSIGVAAKPWELLADIKAYHKTLMERLTVYKGFVASESQVLGKVRLNGKFNLTDVMKHGIKYHSFSFIPKSYWQAVKSGDAKTFFKYLTDNESLWTKLKHVQGELVKKRADDIGKTISKIEDFQKAVKNGHVTSRGDDMMGDLLSRMSDDEILALQEISKRSKGIMRNFKTVFKDHQRVVSGLRPISYLYGQAGVAFNPTTIYNNVIMGDIVSPKYKYQKPVEDLVNYYESMAKNYETMSENVRVMRREVEDDIARHIKIDASGNRTYLD